jgi:hypothetical protein
MCDALERANRPIPNIDPPTVGASSLGGTTRIRIAVHIRPMRGVPAP